MAPLVSRVSFNRGVERRRGRNIIPANLVEIYAWGGGGAGGYTGGSGAGGGGGAVYAQFLASEIQPYSIVVGGGGQSMNANAGAGPTVNGGGGLSGTQGYGGQGGGYSGIFLGPATQSNSIAIAGGGGGGAWEGAAGGAGGGLTGVAGGNGAAAGGGGGTQSAGGTSSHPGTGTALKGGDCSSSGDGGGGGGGGGGYWGGGAGSGANPGSAGGGGSGFVSTIYALSGTLTSGSGSTAGDSSNPLRGSYGNGGASGANNGTQGVVIIRYLGTPRYAGGTITQSGGYTTHTFTSPGTFSGNYVATTVTNLNAADWVGSVTPLLESFDGDISDAGIRSNSYVTFDTTVTFNPGIAVSSYFGGNYILGNDGFTTAAVYINDGPAITAGTSVGTITDRVGNTFTGYSYIAGPATVTKVRQTVTVGYSLSMLHFIADGRMVIDSSKI